MASADTKTLGVEEEFLLVGPDGRIVARGPEVSDRAAAPNGQVERELTRCQVEVATDVCHGIDQVIGGLRELRSSLAFAAGQEGLRLLPAGTAPVRQDGAAPITEDARYQRMAREFGGIARAVLTCACHVHVSIPDRAAGLAVSNALRPWLPVLLALTANSPFHDGADTGYASWRYVMWNRWPSAGPPPHFESVDEYESLAQALLRSGAVLDRGMLYWHVRLSEHAPTLEIRISDVAATVDEAALLAALVRGLAARALDDGATSKTRLAQEVLRAGLWRAARDGLSGRCDDPVDGHLVPAWTLIDRLVDHIRSQLRQAGDTDFVAQSLAWLRESGGGADRQRAIFDRRQRLTDVIDELAWPVPAAPSGMHGSAQTEASDR